MEISLFGREEKREKKRHAISHTLNRRRKKRRKIFFRSSFYWTCKKTTKRAPTEEEEHRRAENRRQNRRRRRRRWQTPPARVKEKRTIAEAPRRCVEGILFFFLLSKFALTNVCPRKLSFLLSRECFFLTEKCLSRSRRGSLSGRRVRRRRRSKNGAPADIPPKLSHRENARDRVVR